MQLLCPLAVTFSMGGLLGIMLVIGLEFLFAWRVFKLSRAVSCILCCLVAAQLWYMTCMLTAETRGKGELQIEELELAVADAIAFWGSVCVLMGCLITAAFFWLVKGSEKNALHIEEKSYDDELPCLSCGALINAGRQSCQKCGWTWK